MIHDEDCKEGRSPAAQACWRRNVFGKGITLTEQQITSGQHSHYYHCCIKHNIERIFPKLIVHD